MENNCTHEAELERQDRNQFEEFRKLQSQLEAEKKRNELLSAVTHLCCNEKNDAKIADLEKRNAVLELRETSHLMVEVRLKASEDALAEYQLKIFAHQDKFECKARS